MHITFHYCTNFSVLGPAGFLSQASGIGRSGPCARGPPRLSAAPAFGSLLGSLRKE